MPSLADFQFANPVVPVAARTPASSGSAAGRSPAWSFGGIFHPQSPQRSGKIEPVQRGLCNSLSYLSITRPRRDRARETSKTQHVRGRKGEWDRDYRRN